MWREGTVPGSTAWRGRTFRWKLLPAIVTSIQKYSVIGLRNQRMDTGIDLNEGPTNFCLLQYIIMATGSLPAVGSKPKTYRQ